MALPKMYQFRGFLSFYSPAKIGWTKLEFENDCHFRSDRWFTDSTVIKITNEKKDIFSFIRII